MNASGSFWPLRNKETREKFNHELLRLLAESEFWIVSVVLDKLAHQERYGELAIHPYHVCVLAILERYAGFLNAFNASGDVMAEARGGVEDRQLKEAYRRAYESGTSARDASFFQSVLTSREIKLRSKAKNIAGLQVADLFAHSCKDDILLDKVTGFSPRPGFEDKIREIAKTKYNRRVKNGKINFFGKIFFGNAK